MTEVNFFIDFKLLNAKQKNNQLRPNKITREVQIKTVPLTKTKFNQKNIF